MVIASYLDEGLFPPKIRFLISKLLEKKLKSTNGKLVMPSLNVLVEALPMGENNGFPWFSFDFFGYGGCLPWRLLASPQPELQGEGCLTISSQNDYCHSTRHAVETSKSIAPTKLLNLWLSMSLMVLQSGWLSFFYPKGLNTSGGSRADTESLYFSPCKWSPAREGLGTPGKREFARLFHRDLLTPLQVIIHPRRWSVCLGFRSYFFRPLERWAAMRRSMLLICCLLLMLCWLSF